MEDSGGQQVNDWGHAQQLTVTCGLLRQRSIRKRSTSRKRVVPATTAHHSENACAEEEPWSFC